MNDIINILPDHVVNQIAAGEVINRPSSVVKELIDNSIDAESTIIKILIQDGGKKSIQIIDNGIGMTNNDAKIAFKRHSTSKLKSTSDLFTLNTKGFRGEALSSISSISIIEIKTRQINNEFSLNFRIENGVIKDEKFDLSSKGTSITVKNLFYNIPARRKFLKSDLLELKYIIDEIQRSSISHPDIHFIFYNNSKEIFNFKPKNLKSRILDVFGKKISEMLVPISEKTPVVNISGYILKPEFARKSKPIQFFFVNKRFVKSSFFNHSVLSAFEGLIKEGYKPGYLLFFDVKNDSIDINIHPNKIEVKFENEQSIYSILRASIKHSLGMFSVIPTIDFDYNSELDSNITNPRRSVKEPMIEINSNFNPFILKNEDIKNENFFKIESESFKNFDGKLDDLDNYRSKIFQIMEKYIVCNVQSKLLIINQVRAHQRILYEKFLHEITQQSISTQKLLIPLKYEFPKSFQLKEIIVELKESGFLFGNQNKEYFEIIGVPSNIKQENTKNIIYDIFSSIENRAKNNDISIIDVIAKSLSKKNAIGKKTLKKIEQERILDDLFCCKENLISPFGKKIFHSLTINEIDNKFKI